MSQYSRRVIGIVVAPLVAVVNAAIHKILGEGYEDNLTVPLSPTGEEPATHFAGSAQVTEAQRDAVVGLMDPTHGVYGFRSLAYGVDNPNEVPTVDVWPEAPDDMSVKPTELRWDFDAAIASLGLRRVQPPMPDEAKEESADAVAFDVAEAGAELEPK